MGEHSLLLVDSAQHKRARKLLMPAFNGHALRGYEDDDRPAWPRPRSVAGSEGEAFALAGADERAHPRGDPPGRLRRHRRGPARRAAPAGEQDRQHPARWSSSAGASRGCRSYGPWRRTFENQAALDRVIYAEIAERREADRPGRPRTDVLSRLLLVRDDEDPATPASPTRSCATSWSPCCSPATRPPRPRWPGRCTSSARTRSQERKARDAASAGDDDYLEAVLKESMRLHPVIPMVVRHLMEPATIGGIDLPRGANVAASIILAHESEDEPPRPRPASGRSGSSRARSPPTPGSRSAAAYGAASAPASR